MRRFTGTIFMVTILMMLFFSHSMIAQKQLNNFSDDVRQLADRVNKSVVQIIVTSYGPGYGQGSQNLVKVRGSGSGFIVDPAGYIVTNTHVVDGAIEVIVRLNTEVEKMADDQFIMKGKSVYLSAQIVGMNKMTDIAVLKIDGEDYPTLDFANSNAIRAGDLAFAFGSPRGLSNSVTMGIISATARQLSSGNPLIYIQTDAPINPGNSGGPLVSTKGEVMGINTMIFSQSGGSEGLGFAVPSNAAKYVSEQIREFGRLKVGTIGVNAQDISGLMQVGLQLSQRDGVILSDVIPGGPAFVAGLKEGDIVIAVDGVAIQNHRQFVLTYMIREAGDIIAVNVLRGTDRFKINVKVVELPDVEGFLKSLIDYEKNLVKKFGFWGIEISPELLALSPGFRKQKGIIVAALVGNSSAQEDGFQPGDIIYSINRMPMLNMEVMNTFVEDVDDGDPIVVHLERKGTLRFLEFIYED
jgi:serine protease Do